MIPNEKRTALMPYQLHVRLTLIDGNGYVVDCLGNAMPVVTDARKPVSTMMFVGDGTSDIGAARLRMRHVQVLLEELHNALTGQSPGSRRPSLKEEPKEEP